MSRGLGPDLTPPPLCPAQAKGQGRAAAFHIRPQPALKPTMAACVSWSLRWAAEPGCARSHQLILQACPRAHYTSLPVLLHTSSHAVCGSVHPHFLWHSWREGGPWAPVGPPCLSPNPPAVCMRTLIIDTCIHVVSPHPCLMPLPPHAHAHAHAGAAWKLSQSCGSGA